MITIKENAFKKIELDPGSSIFMYHWKATTGEMTVDQFMAESMDLLDTYLQHGTRSVLAVDFDFRFPIEPELQTQANALLLSKLNGPNLRKFAHVISGELITQLSVEQLFEENEAKTYADRYFEDREAALDWCRR